MRHIWESPGKGLVKWSMVLLLATGIWCLFETRVVQAQSDPSSCEVSPLPMRVPTNQFDTGLVKHVSGANDMSLARTKLELEVNNASTLLACGSNHQEPFFAPPLRYTLEVDKRYIKSTSVIQYQTVFVSCIPMTRSEFPINPDVDVENYMEPWVNFNSSQVFRVPAEGVIPTGVQQVSRNFGLKFSLTSNGQNYPLNQLSSLLNTTSWQILTSDNNQVIYSHLIQSQAVAITYLEYSSTLSYLPYAVAPLTDQLRRDITSHTFAVLAEEIASQVPGLTAEQRVLIDSLDEDISLAKLSVDVLADVLILTPTPYTVVAGLVLKVGLIAFNTLEERQYMISKTGLYAELQNLYPYQYSSLYSLQELTVDGQNSSVGRKLNQLGVYAPSSRLLGVKWRGGSRTLEVAGSAFNQKSSLHVVLRKPDGSVFQSILFHAYSNQFYPLSSAYARSVYLDFGQLYTRFFIEPGISIPTGCYFVSAQAYEQNQATVVTARAGNFVWIDGSGIAVDPQSATAIIPGNGSSSTERTCSNPVNLITSEANLFAGTNCTGLISWFSGHPSDGPGASGQGSLFVPPNAVVNISSNDGNQGDRSCFAATVPDLAAVGWADRIQWAELVVGGSCPPPPVAGAYVIHTNSGDFTVSTGQTWDNMQHNRQIWGFDEIGTANLVINHRGGASRCWNETKSASSLHSDGDWWLQTASIVVSGGNCPGNDGELIVFVNNNFQSGEHSRVQAGTTHLYEDNNRKGSFKFTKPGMSAIFKVAGGRTRCWNTDVTALGDHEDYGTRTIEIKAFGTNVCPPPRAPEPPSNLTASVNGADQVTLSWTNDYGYNGGTSIWAKYPNETAFIGNLSVGEGGTSFTYFVASCGQSVEYYVEAVASDGRTAQSNHVTASTNSCSNLVAPTNFRATPMDFDSVRLDWDNNQSGVWEGYLVSYQKADGSWVEIWPAGRSQNYFDINGLTPCSQPWTMAVASYQNATRSPKSLPVTFTLPQCPHEIGITSFAATMQANNTANLSWDPHPHATGYIIDYSYNGAAFQPFQIGVTSSYNGFGGFSCGTAVRLRLSAQTPTGRTTASEVAFTANQCPTSAPENFTVTQNGMAANLSWTAHPYATGYIIDYSYNGAAFQPFQIGVTSSYNGWMGYSCGSTVTLRLSANTPYGRSAYAEQTFTAPLCGASAGTLTEQIGENDAAVQTQRLFLPLVNR